MVRVKVRARVIVRAKVRMMCIRLVWTDFRGRW